MAAPGGAGLGQNPAMQTQTFPIRPAEPRDLTAIVGLIRELADFEQLTHLLQVDEERLRPHLFGPQPKAEAIVAEDDSGQVVAFALFFHNFSTFLAQPGLYLEDLYVQPAYRGTGLGRQLLRHLAQLAVARGCGRFEWSVLDWNQRAIGFYEGMGVTVMPDWRICRLSGEALQALGKT